MKHHSDGRAAMRPALAGMLSRPRSTKDWTRWSAGSTKRCHQENRPAPPPSRPPPEGVGVLQAQHMAKLMCEYVGMIGRIAKAPYGILGSPQHELAWLAPVRQGPIGRQGGAIRVVRLAGHRIHALDATPVPDQMDKDGVRKFRMLGKRRGRGAFLESGARTWPAAAFPKVTVVMKVNRVDLEPDPAIAEVIALPIGHCRIRGLVRRFEILL